nr:hypothetical protein [Ningiella sp. W23]
MNNRISPSTAATVANRVYDIKKVMISMASFTTILSETLKSPTTKSKVLVVA